MMGTSSSRRGRNGWPLTLRRGIVHLLFGLAIAACAYTFDRAYVLTGLGAFTLVYLSVDMVRLRWMWLSALFNFFFGPFMRPYEESRITGASFMFVASLVTLTLFGREAAVLAVTFLAVGDPLAHIVRDGVGRTKLFRKTLEGALACLAGCAAAAAAWHAIGLEVGFVAGWAGALTAAIVQVLPLPADDNLSMPLVSGLIIWAVRFLAP